MFSLAARFVLELVGVVLAGYAAWTIAAGSSLQPVAAICASALLIVAWALVAAPKARNPLAPRTRQLVGTGFLLLVAVALAWAGQSGAAAAFGVAVVLDQVALLVLEPDVTAIASRYDVGR